MSVTSRPSLERARRVADAVLYEGYVLYPYRASAAKNQVRWQFGVVAPHSYSTTVGSDPWSMRTECLVESVGGPVLDVTVRFLAVQSRVVEAPADDGRFEPVASLEVDDTTWSTWDEAVEEEVHLADVTLDPLDRGWRRAAELPFTTPSTREVEALVDAAGRIAGRVVRRREAVRGTVRVEADWLADAGDLVKVRVTIENHTDWCEPAASRDEIARRSLVSAHTLLAVRGGDFVSLMDPPEHARTAAASCENEGTYPVLAGDEGDRDIVLSSPIILYDHPEIAPESEGELCDSTEIDEILLLRVLTMTDEEKREARATDPRAAEIVDRADSMPPEIFERLHGAVRYLGSSLDSSPGSPIAGLEPESGEPPWWDPSVDEAFDPGRDTVRVAGVDVGAGSRVRLRPLGRGDAHDMFIDGREATVHAVVHDVDGDVHVGVTIDDDPGAELQIWQRRFSYFKPHEIEVIAP